MPTLNWIGKEAVVDHHRHVPTRLLECDPEFSVGDPDAENLLVEGDNLEALKALLPRYRGQVKCIYIDPPYNTGNEGWIYNDNVNDPRIRQWLGETVGREAEDLCRHDKWLCMMYPRLALLREFLREDGAIFISIDDNEQPNCRLLCDDVFGPNNFVANVIWHKRISPANDAKWFSSDHDHILVYAQRKDLWRPNRLPRTEEQLKYYSNPDDDPRGPWNSAAYTCAKTAEERPNLYHPVTNPNTGEIIWPRRNRVWAYGSEAHERNVAQGLLYWGKDGKAKMPRLKKFLGTGRLVVPRSIWTHAEAGHNQEAKLEILEMVTGNPFATPKPTRLIRRILQSATDGDSLVLDSFAGSGTTGHAVLALNRADGGTRRFIAVEMDPMICRDVTAQRLKRAVEGYSDKEPLGSGFRYCRLGRRLLDENGNVNADVPFADLARYVFLLETGVPVPKRPRKDSALLGVHRGRAVYLLYNGMLGDKRPAGGNVLTSSVLAGLPPHPDGHGPGVIYGEACRLSEATLNREGITFRPVPYALRESGP